MLEQKEFCINMINSEKKLPSLSYQYLLWNQQVNFQTASFLWLTMNASLLAAIEEKAINHAMLDILNGIDEFSKLEKLFKVPEELNEFSSYSRIVPFRKIARGSQTEV